MRRPQPHNVVTFVVQQQPRKNIQNIYLAKPNFELVIRLKLSSRVLSP